MLTHQGCPQTPGGRIRALGFARMGAGAVVAARYRQCVIVIARRYYTSGL